MLSSKRLSRLAKSSSFVFERSRVEASPSLFDNRFPIIPANLTCEGGVVLRTNTGHSSPIASAPSMQYLTWSASSQVSPGMCLNMSPSFDVESTKKGELKSTVVPIASEKDWDISLTGRPSRIDERSCSNSWSNILIPSDVTHGSESLPS